MKRKTTTIGLLILLIALLVVSQFLLRLPVAMVADEPGTNTALLITGNSADTSTGGGGPKDGSVGIGVRNTNTMPGNYSYICLQGVDTSGQAYCGIVLAAKLQEHGASPLDKFTEFIIYAQMEHTDALSPLMWLRWDKAQNGPVLGLGTPGYRQGLNLDYRLPIAFYDQLGNLRTSLKCGGFMTCQIGDSTVGAGFDHVFQAPEVAVGYGDFAGSNLVLRGGLPTGSGKGGSVVLSVAPPGPVNGSVQAAVNVVELAGEAVPVFRPITDAGTPLGDALHRWSGMYTSGDVYAMGDPTGMYAKLQAAEARIAKLEGAATASRAIGVGTVVMVGLLGFFAFSKRGRL